MWQRGIIWGGIFFVYTAYLNAGEIVLTPCEDVYIQTGGGEGWNVFMKFDISSVPLGKTIDSVFLKVYVWHKNGYWNGNVSFWNVHSQDWVENDSAKKIWNLQTSDSMHQYAGFGMQLGWTKSVTLRRIFIRDYDVGNSYCTIKMKDPDDMTYIPISSFPIDDTDTLGLGAYWPLFLYICFYPHEHIDSIPKLFIYSEQFGVEEANQKEEYFYSYPNPFSHKTVIRFKSLGRQEGKLQIFDITGRLVRSWELGVGKHEVIWDGTDLMGNKVHSGIYFCKTGNRVKRLNLVR